MNYKGAIIEESLKNKEVLKDIKILETKIDPVTKKHATPWIKQWTFHLVEVSEDKTADTAERISKALDTEHDWYADFKNKDTHFVIFTNKVFKIDRTKKEQYDKAVEHGLSLGIPSYQLDFSPFIKD